jgi:phosphate butyryltransferase
MKAINRDQKEIIDRAIKNTAGGKEKILAIAAAHDENVLHTVAAATHQGIIKPALVGNAEKIGNILEEIGEKSSDYVLKYH